MAAPKFVRTTRSESVMEIKTGLSLETLIVIPVKTGIQLFQRLTGFPLARERRKAKVLKEKKLQSQALAADQI